MTHSSEPPLRLLYDLATGQIGEDDLLVLEAMLYAEGLVACPEPERIRAGRLAQPPRHAAAGHGATLERVTQMARVVFDSWDTPRLATVRGASSPPRQLLLRAQDMEISLHSQPIGANGLRLIGQALGPDVSQGEAFLLADAPPASDATRADRLLPAEYTYGPVAVDDLGEFLFPRIHTGRYVLSLQIKAERTDSVVLDLRAKPGEGRSHGDAFS